jgi:hypothetical protein
MNDENDFFALPAFKADEALLKLKRDLRDLRQLAERDGGRLFTLQGQSVLELAVEGGQVLAKLAKRAAQRPEWDSWTCKSSADMRRLQDEIKKRLVRWTEE